MWPYHALWNWITHDAAGFFTFCLVIVGAGQAGLFVWQLRYMRKGIEDARIAALAAQTSAEAAKEQVTLNRIGIIDLERAYLAVGPTEIRTDYIPQQQKQFYVPSDPMEVTVRLYVHNTGRTSATLKKIYGEFSNMLPLGNTPTYENVEPIITDLSVAAGTRDVLAPFDFKSEYVAQQFFWGYIEYKDIFKNTRTSRFCSSIVPAEANKTGKYQIAGSEGWRECD